MPKAPMLRSRDGSILATSISLVTVFLTLVLGSMAYVQSATSNARTDKLRVSAEEAARSGLDLVLGWAEANIDKETRLPRDWDTMADGAVIDPVRRIVGNPAAVVANPSLVTKAGNVLGANTHEYVVGVQNNYITTFKARVQQFRISEEQPRQFRIGIIGRVRKKNTQGVDGSERGNIVAERVILTYIGKDSASRYAALIDMDSVRNWVPGEITTGPVHINRGYIDVPPYGTTKVKLVRNMANISAAEPFSYLDLRSQMQIQIDGPKGNVGFRAATGQKKYPIFEAPVSMTERYEDGNFPYDPSTSEVPVAISVNGEGWHKATYTANAGETLNKMSYDNKVFAAAENQVSSRYGSVSGRFIAGPTIVPQNIELPRSIRNTLGTAVGAPPGGLETTNWNSLEDGVYLPTSKLFDAANLNAPTIYGTTGIPDTPTPAGAIYVRGNVEVMRMGMGSTTESLSHVSYYIFQVGPGKGAFRRVYFVLANRSTKQMAIFADTKNTRIKDFLNAANTSLKAKIEACFGPGLGYNLTAAAGTAWNTPPISLRNNSLISDFSYNSAGQARAVLGARGDSDYPFSGVIYVDCAQNDPARRATLNGLQTMATSGNILALGNMGRENTSSAQPTKKDYYLIDSVKEEIIATHTNGPTGANSKASKLTIMARGNIFIQNDLIVDGIRKLLTAAELKAGSATELEKITLPMTKDMLGLVSDKQIVVGLAAPQLSQGGNTATEAGVVVTGSIAALGDPAYRPWDATNPILPSYVTVPRCYIGSFTTEGLMQQYNVGEEYYIATGPFTTAASFAAPRTPPVATTLYSNEHPLGFPGNPIYESEGNFTTLWSPSTNNPNIRASRGRLVVHGSITQRKRGLVGQGNLSYDKGFIFDKRLLSTQPPIFPTSTNVIVRAQLPFSPDDGDRNRTIQYATSAGFVPDPSFGLSFLSENSAD